ncbi:hypothetical protein BN2475_310099 [Paraburkholderia ribeironis]|uniref:Uncharacterized protein n=1 Tax=Paraburkholderia ribeironis TaxID=1247936 RepID=A0A1N7S2E2_9BURK|nr:hypothetical protein BN2475_310099 [Paraburkholderia ribeironis]
MWWAVQRMAAQLWSAVAPAEQQVARRSALVGIPWSWKQRRRQDVDNGTR